MACYCFNIVYLWRNRMNFIATSAYNPSPPSSRRQSRDGICRHSSHHCATRGNLWGRLGSLWPVCKQCNHPSLPPLLYIILCVTQIIDWNHHGQILKGIFPLISTFSISSVFAGISSSNTSPRWLKNSSPGSRRCRWRHAARQSSPSSLIWWVQPHSDTRLQVGIHVIDFSIMGWTPKLCCLKKICGAAVLNGFVPGTLPFYICPPFWDSFFSFKMWDWNESCCFFYLFPVFLP